jgi:hypothetical protein
MGEMEDEEKAQLLLDGKLSELGIEEKLMLLERVREVVKEVSDVLGLGCEDRRTVVENGKTGGFNRLVLLLFVLFLFPSPKRRACRPCVRTLLGVPINLLAVEQVMLEVVERQRDSAKDRLLDTEGIPLVLVFFFLVVLPVEPLIVIGGSFRRSNNSSIGTDGGDSRPSFSG